MTTIAFEDAKVDYRKARDANTWVFARQTVVKMGDPEHLELPYARAAMSSLALVPQAVSLARKTLAIVRQNLWWAAGYNALCVPLAVVGWLPAWLAGLGMALSSIVVVAYSLQLTVTRPFQRLTTP